MAFVTEALAQTPETKMRTRSFGLKLTRFPMATENPRELSAVSTFKGHWLLTMGEARIDLTATHSAKASFSDLRGGGSLGSG